MNQILIIIAIVGIGYLLYRSLIIKRQPTDDDNQASKQQVEKTSIASTPGSAQSTSTAQRASTDSKPLTTHNPNPAEPAASHQDSPSVDVTSQESQAAVPAAENPVGKDAVREVHQAEAKAAEKAYMATAAESTKSELEQFAGSGLGSNNAPTVPPEVQTQAAALEETDDPLARHRLYQQVVEQCYRGREDKAFRFALLHYAQAHIAEFGDISGPLKKQNGGKLPQVATFKHYAAVLTDAGQYDEAIAVCQQALSYDLKDGTKTGYQGRIERIEKLKAKAQG
ncbi:MAG: hypothetical protein JJU03_01090 [Idiomarina sp.]|nr:hypothetical protein [Idiomarina sp.]